MSLYIEYPHGDGAFYVFSPLVFSIDLQYAIGDYEFDINVPLQCEEAF